MSSNQYLDEYHKFINYEEVTIPVDEIETDQLRLCALNEAMAREIALYGTVFISNKYCDNLIKFKLSAPRDHTATG